MTDRRCEAVLPGLDEVLPLVVQIEHQRRRIALGLGQRSLARDDEAEPRNALDALVGRRGDGVDLHRPHVDRQRTERAHAVQQEAPVVICSESSHLVDRVQDAAGRLAMHHEDVGDGGVRLEHRADGLEIGRRVLRRLVHDDGAASDLEKLPGALAIGAIDQQQDLAGRRAKVVSIASTATCGALHGTVTWVAAPCAISGSRSSTSRLILRNVASREPQSCTMTDFTDFDVVSGPGVSSSGSPVSEAPFLAVVVALMVHCSSAVIFEFEPR
jgi:hypothetical protein